MRVIQTERLMMRDFIEEDWPALEAMLLDPELTRYMHFSKWTAAQRRDWFETCLSNSCLPETDVFNWALAHRETEQVLGWLGIGGELGGQRGFGYFLARKVWGKGLMTEALRTVVQYEFETLKTSYLSATCETANPASARVMEKAGMNLVRTLYDADWEGNWAERHHYAMANPQLGDV